MTEPPADYLQRVQRRRRRSARRRIRTGRVLALLLFGAVVFILGIALGEALEDNPAPGGGRTFVRTFAPLPSAPVPRTVTVTVPSP